MVEGTIFGFDLPVRILTIYGPHIHKHGFWENIRDANLFDHNGLILGGELNLIDSEIWRAGRLNDPL